MNSFESYSSAFFICVAPLLGFLLSDSFLMDIAHFHSMLLECSAHWYVLLRRSLVLLGCFGVGASSMT